MIGENSPEIATTWPGRTPDLCRISELAKTGGSAPGALIALGGATTLAGAAMLAVTRRRKQS